VKRRAARHTGSLLGLRAPPPPHRPPDPQTGATTWTETPGPPRAAPGTMGTGWGGALLEPMTSSARVGVWFTGSGSQGLVHRVWFRGSGSQGLVHRVWFTGSGSEGLVQRVWFTGSGSQGLVQRVWFTGSGSEGLVHRVLFTGSGSQGLVHLQGDKDTRKTPSRQRNLEHVYESSCMTNK